MTKDEARERFNGLPREIRTTIIGSELVMQIRLLERERKAAMAAHGANLRRINDRIKLVERALADLKDD